MRKVAPLLAVTLLLLLVQVAGGLLTVCVARDGLVRLELVHGDCCDPQPAAATASCCASRSEDCAGEPAAGLASCCESVDLLFVFPVERSQENGSAAGSSFAAALALASTTEAAGSSSGNWREARPQAAVPRPPPGLICLRTVVFLC
ncbi:MAG: hypothetical protein ISR76_08440 [Planctomycetes bacterium]|nr:hypothetical protein [Planctomycetota bacterium]MBL7009011.1 hypothetical protein [Planctomycetota bacterium]